MRKPLIAFALLLLCASAAFAQDWVRADGGAAEYNCTLMIEVAAEFGAYSIAKVDSDHYNLIDFFQVFVSSCVIDKQPPTADPGHIPEWTKSAMHQTEYDCAILRSIRDNYGQVTLVKTATAVHLTLTEFFASLVPDCLAEVDIAELNSRFRTSEGWVTGWNEDFQFNCDFVSAAIAEYGHLDLYRDEAETLSVAEFFHRSVPLCVARADLSAKTEITSSDDGWLSKTSGSQTNCDTVKLLINQYGAPDLLRENTETWTLFNYYQDILPTCIPYAILANESTALRECPSDDCEETERLERDTVLAVTGLRDSWLQTDSGDKDAFLPLSSDLPRAQIAVLPNDGRYLDQIRCFFSPLALVDGPLEIKTLDLSNRERDTDFTLYSPPQSLGMYMVKLVRDELTVYVAVPVEYRTSYEFMISCD